MKELEEQFAELSGAQQRSALSMMKTRWWIIRGGSIFLIIVVSGMAGCPQYNVWQQGLKGEAELARAEQNRQIEVERAGAVKASASDLAEAEVIRAQGVKDANDIIAEGLGGPEGYLRYLYINGLMQDSNGCEVIYVATEAGLPILEANRLQKPTTIHLPREEE